MSRRMLRYYNDIKIKFNNLKVNQYLIYIGKEKLYMKDHIKEDNLNYKYIHTPNIYPQFNELKCY